jgi:hypothetical protein
MQQEDEIAAGRAVDIGGECQAARGPDFGRFHDGD